MALSKITNLSITDDTIVNADIKTSAAIALTKLSGGIDLAASGAGGVTGILPIANGGTAATTFLAAELANTPAFTVYASAATSCANSTNTTLAYNTETLDNGGCFNNTAGTVTLNGVSVPAYSFGPNVAGYYLFGAGGYFSSAADYDGNRIFIEKNGSVVVGDINGRNLYYNGMYVGGLTHLNGTSDYVRVRVLQSSGGTLDFSSENPGFFGLKTIGA